jgi:type VII secretion protein EccE
MTTMSRGRADPPVPDRPPAAGRRRRGNGAPAPFAHTRPPQRTRPGITVLGLPMVTLIAVELVAICALCVAAKRTPVTVIAVAVGVIVIVTTLLRRRRVRIGTWLALRVAYLFRHRETLVAAGEYARDRRRSDDPADGPGGANGANGADEDREANAVDVAAELEAFFPGMTVWEARTHDGDRMGVVQWHGLCAATVRMGPPAGIVRSRNTADNVPIEAIMAALDQPDLGLDAVQVLTQTIVGEQDAGLTPLLPAAAAELFGTRARLRNRASFVTVRVDPASAADAVSVRGGGNLGIARVLSAALSRVGAAAGQAGLEVGVLDAAQANRAIADSFYHLATPYDPIIRWVESTRQITSTRMAHRSFIITDVRRPTLPELPIGNVFAYALATQARPMRSGEWSTRTVLRVTCRSTDSLNTATRELRPAARRMGVSMQPLDAAQHLGVRATVPIGGV